MRIARLRKPSECLICTRHGSPRRSLASRQLGHAGLAQSNGFVSPVALIQSVSGISRGEATKLIEVGGMLSSVAGLADVPAFAAESLWQQPIADAVTSGTLSLDGAEAIRRGLGSPNEAVTGRLLGLAAQRVIASAKGKSVEQLQRDARLARLDLDFESVATCERQQRELRYLHAHRRGDGMVEGRFLLAPEDGTYLLNTLDAVTSPRRGGPRFVNADDRADAQRLLEDDRSNEQINADTLVNLLRVAVEADPSKFPGTTRPAVRVITTDRARLAGEGVGMIEGTVDAVSFETLSRYFCNDGLIPVEFDDEGQSINLGRDQRLFNPRQRIAMSVRDGGCTFPGCDRPPSWCEAHHLDYWARDGGETNVADGVLLCRRHHLLLHNNHWEIVRESGAYWIVPPASIDPKRERRRMQRRSPMVDRALRRRIGSGSPE
jgi:hypothetical protein